jgi:hypothetical protein
VETNGPKNMFKFLSLKKKRKLKWQEFIIRFWPYLSALLLLLIILALLSPYLFRPFTLYPEKLRAEIAWRKFVATFHDACRESCLAARQSYASIWRPIYRSQPALAQANFSSAFTDDNEALQAALIKIMAADYGSLNLPPLLAQLLMSEQTSLENKRLIVTFFSESFNDPQWFEVLRAQVLNESLNLADRIYALKLLAPFPELENISLLKQLLLQSLEPELMKAAFNLASTWPVGALSFSELELDQLRQLIEQGAVGPARWRRIWLLSEKSAGMTEARRQRLELLANNENLDSISRGLAADSLFHEFKIEINTPEPSASAWQEFYDSL